MLNPGFLPASEAVFLHYRQRRCRTLRVLGGAALMAALFTAAAVDHALAADEPSVTITPRAPRHPAAPRASIRTDVKVVLIPVSVKDPYDHPVNDLSAEAFRLLEDNEEQKIVSFFKEESPVSVGFIFDASASMAKRMDKSVAAIKRFLENAVPGDEFFLVRFSGSPTLVTPFTSDPGEIMSSLSSLHAEGWTAMLDAIYLGVQHLKLAKNPRRALFILSDGGDNSSRYSESEIRNLVIESDVRIFAIGLFERPKFLQRIAAETGGNAYTVHHLRDLPEVIDKISLEFRSQYVIGYSSNRMENDGKYRKIHVELIPKILAPLRLAWRHGYYAPGD